MHRAVLLMSLLSGCFFSSDLTTSGDLGDRCGAGTPCGDGLECEDTYCHEEDSATSPRVFGDFEAIYSPDDPTRRMFETFNNARFVMLDGNRLVGGTSIVRLVDFSTGQTRNLVTSSSGGVPSVARTTDAVWVGAQGFALPALTPIVTGIPAGVPGGQFMAANEAGLIAWWAPTDGMIHVLDAARENKTTLTVENPSVAGVAIEPDGKVVYAAGGVLASPNGRAVSSTPDYVVAVSRPHGGPTLVQVRGPDLNAPGPTRILILAADGTLQDLVTLPDELYGVTYVERAGRRLYVLDSHGLFFSRSDVLP